jgi:hypothetical protein
LKIARVDALRIRQPEFEEFTWWATSPLDALYDEGRRRRDRGAALFNAPIDSRGDAVFHFVTPSREILARRWGIARDRHRLGKDLGDFGREMVARCSRSLGSLAVGDAAGVSS